MFYFSVFLKKNWPSYLTALTGSDPIMKSRGPVSAHLAGDKLFLAVRVCSSLNVARFLCNKKNHSYIIRGIYKYKSCYHAKSINTVQKGVSCISNIIIFYENHLALNILNKEWLFKQMSALFLHLPKSRVSDPHSPHKQSGPETLV